MLIVVIPVFLLTFGIAWKYREENKKAKHDPEWADSFLAEAIWWGIPCVIIAVLGFFTWRGCHELDPFRPLKSETKALPIQVVALQWKWLFIYPEQGIATVNFVQFPENTPLDFEITSDAPMNSFWIPSLGGQIYAMSGMRSKVHLIANEAGKFRGSSANISGAGFSGMTFTAQATSREEFEGWVESVKASSPLSREIYLQLAQPSEYNQPASYVLADEGLFDWVIMKYMMP
jgi:cytochrome o ubiquinol oxidase subunit 2